MTNVEIIARQENLLSGRQMFDLEIVTTCNKACNICPRNKFERNGKSISSQTFDILLRWLPVDCDIMLAGFGEPLLNPQCAEYVRRLTDSGRSCTILTNGKKLTAALVDDLFEAGLNKLQISILQNEGIEQILKYVPLIRQKLRGRVCFNIIKEENDFALSNTDDVKKLGFSIDIKNAHNRGGWLCEGSPDKEIRTCGTFFSVSFISADGDIFCCSNDINGSFAIGNVRDISFDELLKHKRKFLGNISVCNLCDSCTDEYRIINFKRR